MGNKVNLKKIEKNQKSMYQPEKSQKIYKAIILGCFETGKSTIFKQITNQFGNINYSIEEKLLYKRIIQKTILYSAHQLSLSLQEDFQDEELKEDLSKIEEFIKNESMYNIDKKYEEFLSICQKFFQEPIVKEKLKKMANNQLNFMIEKGLELYSLKDYLPSNEGKKIISHTKTF
jgi:translation initiation factor 2 beta subunit (eIF-2beta)/eIF-5